MRRFKPHDNTARASFNFGLIVLTILSMMFLASSDLSAQSRGKSEKSDKSKKSSKPDRKPQLIIDSVQISDPTISIFGKNFGDNPTVFIPGASLSPLQLQPPSTDVMVVAMLPPNVTPGTYVVIVSRGPSSNDTFAIDVSIVMGRRDLRGRREPMEQTARMAQMGRMV